MASCAESGVVDDEVQDWDDLPDRSSNPWGPSGGPVRLPDYPQEPIRHSAEFRWLEVIAPERVIVEVTRETMKGSRDGSDEVVVIEEHSPPRRSKSDREIRDKIKMLELEKKKKIEKGNITKLEILSPIKQGEAKAALDNTAYSEEDVIICAAGDDSSQNEGDFQSAKGKKKDQKQDDEPLSQDEAEMLMNECLATFTSDDNNESQTHETKEE